MNPIRSRVPLLLTLNLSTALGLLVTMQSVAADRVEIEVATEPGLSPIAPQQWARLLGKLDFSRVRLRSLHPGDTPKLEAHETPGGHRYRIVAILNQREQLLLPGATFTQGDLPRLRAYLQRLREEGPQDFGSPRGRFGLTAGQLQTTLDSLAQTVPFSTAGQSVQATLEQLARQLSLPIEIAPEAETILAQGELIENELQGQAAGTSLALLLRAQGLVLIPEKPRGQPLQLRVARPETDRQAWPVGWKLPTAPRRLLPGLYQRRVFEIDGYSLAEALEALSPRIGVPIRFDRWLLARQQIVPDQIQVTFAREKTYLKRVVDRLLSQARLAWELRVDERGNPFFWITQFGAQSPRAERFSAEQD